MREDAQVRAASGNALSVQVAAVSGGTVMQLRSWVPRHARSGPVVVGGQQMPSHVGEILSGAPRVLCMGPQEWLLVSQEHDATGLRAHIEPDLATQCLVLADLTDGFAVFEVSGPAARQVLSKGCGLDLHSRTLNAGQCGRTRFAQISVIVECLDAHPRFQLYVGRSYARYLYAWLTDAATEFSGASA